MSDDGLNKLKAMFQGKGEEFAEKAGQKLGAAAFEVKKALDTASPLAKSALGELATAVKSARESFEKAMNDAESAAKAKAKAEQEASRQAAAKAQDQGASADAPKTPSA